jgi:DNA-binding winged helix-turn-helix (wHTH) protein
LYIKVNVILLCNATNGIKGVAMIYIDPKKRELSHNHMRAVLSDKEYLFLDFLLQHRGREKVPAESLIHYVWQGKASTITQNNLSQLAYRVKSRIEAVGIGVEIHTSIKNGCDLTFKSKEAIIINKFPLLFKLLKKLLH